MDIFIPKISTEHEANIVREILSKAIADIERQRANIRATKANRKDHQAWRRSIIQARDFALKNGADATACHRAAMRFNVHFYQVEHFVHRKQIALKREATANRRRTVLIMKSKNRSIDEIQRATEYSRSHIFAIIKEAKLSPRIAIDQKRLLGINGA